MPEGRDKRLLSARGAELRVTGSVHAELGSACRLGVVSGPRQPLTLPPSKLVTVVEASFLLSLFSPCFCKSEQISIETLRSPKCSPGSCPSPGPRGGDHGWRPEAADPRGMEAPAHPEHTGPVAGSVYYAKLLSQIAIKHIQLLNTYKSLKPNGKYDEKLTACYTV